MKLIEFLHRQDIRDLVEKTSLKEDIKNEIWKEVKFYLAIFDKLG